MIKLEEAFKKKAFIPYVLAFYPNEEKTIKYIDALIDGGASLIEIGIPFSDPVAEGPTIQKADIVALKNDFTIDKLFNLMRVLKDKYPTFPFVFMTYLNPVFRYGYDNFFKNMDALDISGIIIPDLPYEEQDEVNIYANKYDISVISLIAPSSSDRIKKIASKAKGFIYLVSSLGVTGTRDQIDTNLKNMISEIRKYTNIPIAVGFGIKDKNQAKEISSYADGIIIGSKIIDIIEEDYEKSEKRVNNFAKDIVLALNN